MRWFLIFIVIINIYGFALMGIDKRFAKIQGHRRIPEKTLLLTALFGGAVGSYLGMKTFHHKTLHNQFRFGIPAMILLHLILIGLYIYRFGII